MEIETEEIKAVRNTKFNMLAQVLDQALEKLYNKKMGFMLVAFPFGDDDGRNADYVSNGNRQDMIKFLRETADRFENNEVKELHTRDAE